MMFGLNYIRDQIRFYTELITVHALICIIGWMEKHNWLALTAYTVGNHWMKNR